MSQKDMIQSVMNLLMPLITVAFAFLLWLLSTIARFAMEGGDLLNLNGLIMIFGVFFLGGVSLILSYFYVNLAKQLKDL